MYNSQLTTEVIFKSSVNNTLIHNHIPCPQFNRVQHCLLLRLAARHFYRSSSTLFSWFRLLPFCSPLLQKSLLLFFLWLLRCFNSPACLFLPMNLAVVWKVDLYRESSDLRLFSTPWSILSLTTPFLVFRCLGIHHKPFFIWTSPLNLRLCHPKVLLGGKILSTSMNDKS